MTHSQFSQKLNFQKGTADNVGTQNDAHSFPDRKKQISSSRVRSGAVGLAECGWVWVGESRPRACYVKLCSAHWGHVRRITCLGGTAVDLCKSVAMTFHVGVTSPSLSGVPLLLVFFVVISVPVC